MSTQNLKTIFTPDLINHYKDHQNEITPDLLEKLRSLGNQGKQCALDILDIPKNIEGYYVDAFGNPVSCNGDRQLKRPFTKFNLEPIHLQEITRCSQDLEYFKDNYVKIKTKSGINFPDIREYQNEFLRILNGPDENIVGLLSRQCVDRSTVVSIRVDGREYETNIEDVFKMSTPVLGPDEKYLETRVAHSMGIPQISVLTPIGYLPIKYVHQTVPLPEVVVTVAGDEIRCAEKHVFFDGYGHEIYAKDTLGKYIDTKSGPKEVLSVEYTGVEKPMYDITLPYFHRYYTNSFLSHNSGKSVTISIYLTWLFTFKENMNIGICANKGALAREFLNNVKNIYVAMPIWMQQGITIWNKGSIYNENNMRILTDVPSSNAFRGFTCNVLVIDECAFIKPSAYEDFADSFFPSQSAMAWKKNIVVSTANGLNHFYNIVHGAQVKKMMESVDPKTMIELEDGKTITLKEYYKQIN